MKRVYLTLFALLISLMSFALVVSPIAGTMSVCPGLSTTLTDATGGGTWTSSNTSIATVGSASGTVTGVAAGTAVITYNTGSGFATSQFTVNALPTVFAPYFGGSGTICAGSPGVHIYLSGSQTGVNYQLFSSAGAVGSPVLGTGSSLDLGLYNTPTTYLVLGGNATTGCTSSTGSITLVSIPSPAPIAGPSGVCVGSTITLTDATSGGTWSSSNPSVATVGTTGNVTGLSTGSTTITYSNASGCYATTTINAINLVLPITGSTIACVGQNTTLNDASAGGAWASSNTSVAKIGSASGVVTGMGLGSAVISYTVGGSCGAVGTTVTVRSTPASISGITSICAGAVSTLHSLTSFGTWSSGNTVVATVGSASGIVAGLTGGTAPISYTVAGCSTTTTMAIDPTPLISGPGTVCVADTVHLSTTIPGSWTSSNPSVASVDASGVVSGLLPGTSTITINSFSTGCVSTRNMLVTSSCSGTPTGGSANASLSTACAGTAVMLYLTGATTTCGIGYQWQYSPDNVLWYTLTGATFDSVYTNATSSSYYRCKLTCYGSGLLSYSASTFVSVYNNITAHAVYNTPTYFCNGPDYHVVTCGHGPNSNIITYYGDGTSDSTHMITSGADIFHVYDYPGTYTVKQVLRDGTTAQDSVSFSYTYDYCRTLPVRFYFDANSNCLFDGGDNNLYLPVTTEIDSAGIPIDTITAVNGFNYRALGDTNTVYAFKVIGYDPGLHLNCPATGIIYDTISAYVNTYAAKNFGFDCVSGTVFDLGISTYQYCARSDASGTIELYNRYCTPESTVVTMNVDPKYTFASSVPAPFSVVGQTVTWHISSVFNYRGFNPYINYSLRASGPSLLSAGDTIYTNWKITPTVADADTTNNFFEKIDTVHSSYDPNRITVTPAGYVISCTPLTYVINFENTGNDTARNISIIDTLPDNADAHTLKLVAATSVANMSVVRFGGHTAVKFDLPGINLSDSTHHNSCDGQVVFSVQAKRLLADGTIIANHASIYFDDNAPVMTDTAGVTIGISPITGPGSLCNLAQILLNDMSANGVWSRSNTHASVAAGMITGLSAGVDTISYTLSNSCATRSVTAAVTVNPLVIPTVHISTSTGTGDTVCDGIVPYFVASATNGGSTPVYEWQVNSGAFTTGDTFSYAPPVNGDIVTVKLTSNQNCAAPDTAVTSNTITVLTPYIPPITLNAYPGLYIYPGMADTFVVTLPVGSPTPSYQWLLNGAPISGATTDTFVSSTLHTNDSITCVATANDLCHLYSYNSFIVTVGNVGVKNIDHRAAMALFPNPNNGVFTVRGNTGVKGDEERTIEIVNAMGQVVYRNQLTIHGGAVDERVQPDNLAHGMYILNLRSGTDNIMFRFVVEPRP